MRALGKQDRWLLLNTLSIFFILFPFFEGGETATGLFVIHSLVFLLLFITILRYSKISIPPYLIYFLPFFIALLLSSWIAPYKYAAFLDLWDYLMAASFAILVVTLFEEEKGRVDDFAMIAFFTCAVSILISFLFTLPIRFLRASGNFVNPNDFAAFCLLTLILGLFVYERETIRTRKIMISVSLGILSIFIALASSRTVFFASAVFFGLYIWRKKPSRLIAASLVAIMLASAAFLAVRFIQYSDPFQYYRPKIWRHSLKGVLDNPYLGIGLNMLPFTAEKLNFPLDGELGRYSRIARTADSQYFQFLTECGFLGLFTFLVGWTALYVLLRHSNRFLTIRYSYWALSLIAVFSLPLSNTSILFLFIFLISFPFVFSVEKKRTIHLNSFTRVPLLVLLFLFFALFVWLPYMADREFSKASRSTTPEKFAAHVNLASRYNPFQPYYRFSMAKQLIDLHPELSQVRWLAVIDSLNESIELNSAEPDFYVYRARAYRILFNDTRRKMFYNEAASSYLRALYYSPYNVFIRSEFAFFEFRMSHFSIAEEELQKVTQLEPAFINARFLLADTKFRQGKAKEAQTEFQKAEEYVKRYRNHRPSEKYIQRLLLIDHGLREDLRQKLSKKTA